jgi:2'-5' RNA ligase
MGVAFSIESTGLQAIRAALKTEFASWLGQQDMQKWQPHITVQNKATRSKADNLYQELNQNFRPYPIAVVGLDLWEYLGGPWQYSTAVNLKVAS